MQSEQLLLFPALSCEPAPVPFCSISLRERRRIAQKKYRQKHKEKIKERKKQYRQNNQKKMHIMWKEYYKNNRLKIKKYQHEYGQKNRERINERKRKFYEKNRERINQRKRIYDRKRQKKHNKYRQNKYKNDITYAIFTKIRSQFCQFIKKIKEKKNATIFNYLGYDKIQLKLYLESTFKPGMNWQNQGTYWHIDHIVPVSYFANKWKLTNDKEEKERIIKECWALNNLQALEGEENIRKNDLLPDGTRARHLAKKGDEMEKTGVIGEKTGVNEENQTYPIEKVGIV